MPHNLDNTSGKTGAINNGGSALDLFGSVAKRVPDNLLDNLNVQRLSAPASREMREACIARDAGLEDVGAVCRLFTRCVIKTVARTKTQRKFRACIIGAGVMAHRIARMMLESGDLQPNELMMYSRHSQLRDLPEQVYYANSLEDAIVECAPRIIFIACTYGQFERLAVLMKPMLKPTHVVCILVLGISASKAARLLGIDSPVRIISSRHYTPNAHVGCSCTVARGNETAEEKCGERQAHNCAISEDDEFEDDGIGTQASRGGGMRRWSAFDHHQSFVHPRHARQELAEAMSALRDACIQQAIALGLTPERAVEACDTVLSGPGMAQSTRALLFVQEPRSRAKLLPTASAYF